MEQNALISLKGDRATWTGLSDESTMLPSSGSFSILDGCYISKDGTEIRRVPGSRLGGRPFYGQEYGVVSRSGSTIMLDTPLRGTSTTPGDGQAWLKAGTNAIGVWVFSNDTIPTGYYLATRTAADTIELADSFTGTSTDDGEGNDTKILVQRVDNVHALASIGRRAIGVCETATWRNSGAEEANNVSACVSTDPLSFTSYAGPGVQAAYGTETGWIFWPSPTLTGMTDGERGDSATAADRKASAAQHIEVYRRMQVDCVNRRVVIAVPGSGILHQVDVGSGPPWNTVVYPDVDGLPNHRWTKALGIPKGQIGSTSVQTSGGALADAYYGVAVGYWDPATGEAGVPSSVLPVQVSGGGGAGKITVNAVYPRGMCYEASGLGIVVYMSVSAHSTAPEARVNPLLPVAYSGPFATADDLPLVNGTGTPINTFATTSVAIELTQLPGYYGDLLPGRFPVIEFMPIGGSAVRVARGRVFSGGGYPDEWLLEAWGDSQSVGGEVIYYLSLPSDQLAHTGYGETPGSHGSIPTGFGGYRVQRNALTGNGFGRGILLGNVVNETGVSGLGPRVWQVDYQIGDSATPRTAANTSEYVLRNETLRVNFTEEGVASVSPAINRLQLDSIIGDRINGMARINDALLVMTERETLMFTWNTAPRQSSQAVISNRYGCASPGSVVEGPFGVAWLSMDGPVLYAGQGVQWIGKKVREFWKTVKKDSEGQVHNCTATVDQERGLVIWALRSDDWSGSTDVAKAKEATNQWLLWSYVTGEFSTWDLATPALSEAVGLLPYDDGEMKVSWSVADTYHSIYGWDEDSEDQQSSAGTFTVDAARSAGSPTVSVSGDATAYSAGTRAFVRSSDGKEIRWFGEVTAVTVQGSSTRLDVDTSDGSDHGADWKVGDRMVLGVLPMHMRTNRLRFGDITHDNLVSGVALRAEVEADYAYARVTVTDEEGNVSYLTPRWGRRISDGTTRFDVGRFRGTEMVIDVRIWADGRVNVKDIAVEVQGGER